MKLKQVAIAALAGASLLSAGFWLGGASASTNEPGSAADPLVSKSYVDKVIASLLTKTEAEGMVAPLANKSYVDSRVVYQVVTVPRGSKLVAEGGTEVVLRGGQATAVASALGGLFDATGGTDLADGTAIKSNHLLVVPRTDGRGLRAQSDLILLLKGSYTIMP